MPTYKKLLLGLDKVKITTKLREEIEYLVAVS